MNEMELSRYIRHGIGPYNVLHECPSRLRVAQQTRWYKSEHLALIVTTIPRHYKMCFAFTCTYPCGCLKLEETVVPCSLAQQSEYTCRIVHDVKTGGCTPDQFLKSPNCQDPQYVFTTLKSRLSVRNCYGLEQDGRVERNSSIGRTGSGNKPSP